MDFSFSHGRRQVGVEPRISCVLYFILCVLICVLSLWVGLIFHNTLNCFRVRERKSFVNPLILVLSIGFFNKYNPEFKSHCASQCGSILTSLTAFSSPTLTFLQINQLPCLDCKRFLFYLVYVMSINIKLSCFSRCFFDGFFINMSLICLVSFWEF